MSGRKVRHIVIPVAGFGTRMFPCSKAIPKCLFPIYSPETKTLRPLIIEIISEGVKSLSVKKEEIKIGLIISPSQKKILSDFFFTPVNEVYKKKDFLQEDIQFLTFLKDKVEFIVQKEQKGFGHAILCAEKFCSNQPFIMLIGDLIYNSFVKGKNCAKQLVEVFEDKKFEKFDNVVSLTFCNEELLKLNGVCKGKILGKDKIDIVDTYEKPRIELARKEFLFDQKKAKEMIKIQVRSGKSGLEVDASKNLYPIYFGIEIYSPKIFKALRYCEKNNILTQNEINLRDGMKAMIKELKSSMLGVVVSGKKLDCGIPQYYYSSLIDFFEKK